MNGENCPLVDKEVLDMLHEAIGSSLNEIMQLYLTDVPETLQQMQSALEKHDVTSIHRLAHSLKASSANLGAMQTSALAQKLENEISTNETDPVKINTRILELIKSFDQTRTILQEMQF